MIGLFGSGLYWLPLKLCYSYIYFIKFSCLLVCPYQRLISSLLILSIIGSLSLGLSSWLIYFFLFFVILRNYNMKYQNYCINNFLRNNNNIFSNLYISSPLSILKNFWESYCLKLSTLYPKINQLGKLELQKLLRSSNLIYDTAYEHVFVFG